MKIWNPKQSGNEEEMGLEQKTTAHYPHNNNKNWLNFQSQAFSTTYLKMAGNPDVFQLKQSYQRNK